MSSVTTQPHEGEEKRASSIYQSVKQHKIIILAGPTAVGKSDVAARLGNGIVVSADSVQAYPGVQIGANKPTAEERSKTPHLLVDIVDRAETTYNAAEWTSDALYTISRLLLLNVEENGIHDRDGEGDKDKDIEAKARHQQIDAEIAAAKTLRGLNADDTVMPVVVGGTMMYIQWLVHGRPDALRPTKTASEKATQLLLRHQLQQREDGEEEQVGDWPAAVQAVKDMGEKFEQQASKLCVNDWYRLGRIMEVAFTVQELSESKDKKDSSETILEGLYSGQRQGGLLSSSLLYDHLLDVRCFFLCPSDRMTHCKVVDERCEQMLCRGLIEETCDLSLSNALPDMAMRAIGYRQTLDYLGRDSPRDNDEAALTQFVEKFTAATRGYSRKQMQWFRRDTDFCFVPVNMAEPDKETRVAAAAREIQRLVNLPRDKYDRDERLSPQSTSAQTRQQNEKQAKGMRLYLFKPQHLTPDKDAFRHLLQTADRCTHRFQAKRIKLMPSSSLPPDEAAHGNNKDD